MRVTSPCAKVFLLGCLTNIAAFEVNRFTNAGGRKLKILGQHMYDLSIIHEKRRKCIIDAFRILKTSLVSAA